MTTSYIEINKDIWGTDIGALKVKKVHKIPTQVKIDFVKVPKWLIKLHNTVFISVNLIFINRMSFMVSVSKNIKFNAIHNFANMNKGTPLRVIDTIIERYRE